MSNMFTDTRFLVFKLRFPVMKMNAIIMYNCIIIY